MACITRGGKRDGTGRRVGGDKKDKGETKMNNLKNVDSDIIKELESLPIDFWDFKKIDVKDTVHGIHNYPAIMIYPISRNILNITQKYQGKINSLLDPFQGSGTVIVEGVVNGIPKIYGNDLNPLARLITKTKVTAPKINNLKIKITSFIKDVEKEFISINAIVSGLEKYVANCNIDISERNGWGDNAPQILQEFFNTRKCNFEIPKFTNIGFWFTPSVIIKLQTLKNQIIHTEDEKLKDFLLLAFSETVRLSSNTRNGEFKMYRMKAENVIKFNPDVLGIFTKTLDRNLNKVLAFNGNYEENINNSEVLIFSDDSRTLTSIPNNSIDLMVTSPPYGDSRTTVAYGQFSRLSLQWLDLGDIEMEDIKRIDNKLLGGEKITKDFEITLKSETLKKGLKEIRESDEQRATEVYSFYIDLDNSMKAITQKMRINSYQYWVVGNRTVKDINLLTDVIIIELAEQHGLKFVTKVARNISNKVMPSRNSPTNEVGKLVSTMMNEYIVILRKDKE